MARYSVIIASHNRPGLLERALRSVKEQTFRDVTVIVVSDDHSTQTADAARKYLSTDDTYIERGGAPGPALSRNMGLAIASSDYVIFLDDDDEFSPDYLSRLDTYVIPSVHSVLFSDYAVVMDNADRTDSDWAAAQPVIIGTRDPCDIYVKNFIPHACLVYPIELIRRTTFDETLILNEDWDFLLNVAQRYPLSHVPVIGPIVHKTERTRQDRRGAVNDHLLPEIMLRIYKKWPAPTDALRAARQALFVSVGVQIPIEFF